MRQIKQINQVDRVIGTNITRHREAKGLNLDELANSLSVLPHEMQQYENGEKRVGASKLLALSKILCVFPKMFFEELNSQGNTVFFVEAFGQTKFDTENMGNCSRYFLA